MSLSGEVPWNKFSSTPHTKKLWELIEKIKASNSCYETIKTIEVYIFTYTYIYIWNQFLCKSVICFTCLSMRGFSSKKINFSQIWCKFKETVCVAQNHPSKLSLFQIFNLPPLLSPHTFCVLISCYKKDMLRLYRKPCVKHIFLAVLVISFIFFSVPIRTCIVKSSTQCYTKSFDWLVVNCNFCTTAQCLFEFWHIPFHCSLWDSD